MTTRLAGAAYRLPPDSESVASILDRERDRVASALAAVGPALRARVLEELEIDRVRTCGPSDPFDLMAGAAHDALATAGIDGNHVDLILDYSTLPGEAGVSSPLAHRLSEELGAKTSLNLSFKFGGCAGFHLAVKQAGALMRTDPRLKVALLVATDSPPPGNRSLLPITVQGDAGSAVVLTRDGGAGPEIVATEVLTLGHLHRVIRLEPGPGGVGLHLAVDARMLEEEVLPIFYLHFHRLLQKIYADARLTTADIDLVVYSNLSGSDRRGFMRAMGFHPDKAPRTCMAECGHTFASDLVLNYVDLQTQGAIRPGQWLLCASAGIGFTWGVTLVRT